MKLGVGLIFTLGVVLGQVPPQAQIFTYSRLPGESQWTWSALSIQSPLQLTRSADGKTTFLSMSPITYPPPGTTSQPPTYNCYGVQTDIGKFPPGSTGTNFTCTTGQKLTDLQYGQSFRWIPVVDAPSPLLYPVRLMIDSAPPFPISLADGTEDIAPWDIQASDLRTIWFDGSHLRLQDGLQGSALHKDKPPCTESLSGRLLTENLAPGARDTVTACLMDTDGLWKWFTLPTQPPAQEVFRIQGK